MINRVLKRERSAERLFNGDIHLSGATAYASIEISTETVPESGACFRSVLEAGWAGAVPGARACLPDPCSAAGSSNYILAAHMTAGT